MSNSDLTRKRILSTARDLLETSPGAVSMASIARAAGVSRQLLYFHFDGRVDLLVQLSREIDKAVRTPERQARVDNAPDAVLALHEAVALQGFIKPRISGVASAVDRLRRDGDAAATAAWDERERSRLRRCRELARRLAGERKLASNWTEADAARMIWAVTSQRAWHELVVDGGWSTKRWVERTTSLLVDALVA